MEQQRLPMRLPAFGEGMTPRMALPENWLRRPDVAVHSSYDSDLPFDDPDRDVDHVYGSLSGLHYGTEMSAVERRQGGWMHPRRMQGIHGAGYHESARVEGAAAAEQLRRLDVHPFDDTAVNEIDGQGLGGRFRERAALPYINKHEDRGSVSWRAGDLAVQAWEDDAKRSGLTDRMPQLRRKELVGTTHVEFRGPHDALQPEMFTQVVQNAPHFTRHFTDVSGDEVRDDTSHRTYKALGEYPHDEAEAAVAKLHAADPRGFYRRQDGGGKSVWARKSEGGHTTPPGFFRSGAADERPVVWQVTPRGWAKDPHNPTAPPRTREYITEDDY